ncbi:MAG: type IV toxin-antitoxin system AbiEi family antitoxin domain-containing protein [Methylotenera sp.]|nr:type IV toxin-antitoxin system AbiEi family antitoxin domain-containing protein [Methylococcaceae bacterium]MDP3818713.1 type IV toxin-antitoxin system AbiEi family antitoxin domain-containing protein [Methylotenera sp.]
MALTIDTFSFKNLLGTLPRGEPLGTDYLKKKGLTSVHASYLAKHGWLTHLGRGVYMLPGDTLTREGCIAFLSQQIPGLHVAGQTALSWRGIRHNISFRDHIALWGEKRVQLPEWFLSRFDCTYQATALFDPKLPENLGLQALPGGSPSLLVSVPERALLELLSDVGKTESLSEVKLVVEGLHSLREPVLDTLLKHTTRVKVIRLARMLADELDLPWAKLAQKHSERSGNGSRWVAVSKNGERLDLKR